MKSTKIEAAAELQLGTNIERERLFRERARILARLRELDSQQMASYIQSVCPDVYLAAAQIKR